MSTRTPVTLENTRIYFAKLVKPGQYNDSPQKWTLQMRTNDEAEADGWLTLGFIVKKMPQNKDLPEDEKTNPPTYWKTNIHRGVLNYKKEERTPPEVVNSALEPVDGNTIGNNSIANVRYTNWTSTDSKTGKPTSGRLLEGIQLVKHIVYTPQETPGFEALDTATDTVIPESDGEDGDLSD